MSFNLNNMAMAAAQIQTTASRSPEGSVSPDLSEPPQGWAFESRNMSRKLQSPSGCLSFSWSRLTNFYLVGAHWGPPQTMPTLRTGRIPNGGFITGMGFVNALRGLNPFQLEQVDQVMPGTIPAHVQPSNVYPQQTFHDYFGRHGGGIWGNARPVRQTYQMYAPQSPPNTRRTIDEIRHDVGLPPQPRPTPLLDNKKKSNKAARKSTKPARDATIEKKKKSVNAFMAYRGK